MAKKVDIEAMSQKYDEGASTTDLSREYGIARTKVYRLLVKHGTKLRSKSEAQKNTLASGKVDHPTKGRKRTMTEKARISGGLADYWERLSPKKREKRAKFLFDLYDRKTEEEKREFAKLGNAGIRKAAEEGSKLERFLYTELVAAGYKAEPKRQYLVPGKGVKFHIDIYLPDLFTAIEIDGPSHRFAIFGQETLEKQLQNDELKNGHLTLIGMIMIRIEDGGDSTISDMVEFRDKLLSVLEEIKTAGDYQRSKIMDRRITIKLEDKKCRKHTKK